MDSHDAILEQLRRAQSRGLEAITNRLEFVVESLDELVAEAKASIREAVPAEAEQILPVDEVAAAVTALAQRAMSAESEVADLRARIAEFEALLTPPSTAGFHIDSLRSLDAARSQSELLRELLPRLAEHVARAVVLVARAGRISAWSGIGFADGERLRAWNVELDASPLLTRFSTEAAPLTFDPASDPVLAEWLAGEPRTDEAMLIPVCLRGKMMGGLYVDRLSGRPWDPAAAQSMVALTCWMIDTLHHRQVVPAPMLASAVDLRDVSAVTEELAEPEPWAEKPDVGVAPQLEEPELQAPPVEAAPEATAEEQEPPEEPEPVEVEEAVVGVPEAEDVETGLEAEPAEAPESYEEGDTEPEFDPSATMRVGLGEMVTTTPMPVVLPEVEAPPPPVEAAPTPEPPPVAPVAPPVTPAPVEAPTAQLAPEDETRHEEARRFARLLVSEIKLYNEDEVERGRVGRDLYQRLRDDIDRSREMYEKRIPPEVRSVRDYFHAELVRILADGNEDALGM